MHAQDIIAFLSTDRWLTFLLGTLLGPVILKLLDWMLSRRTQKATEWTLIVENYRKEMERLATENARLLALVHTKNLEIEEVWNRIRSLREEMQVILLSKEERLLKKE